MGSYFSKGHDTSLANLVAASQKDLKQQRQFLTQMHLYISSRSVSVGMSSSLQPSSTTLCCKNKDVAQVDDGCEGSSSCCKQDLEQLWKDDSVVASRNSLLANGPRPRPIIIPNGGKLARRKYTPHSARTGQDVHDKENEEQLPYTAKKEANHFPSSHVEWFRHQYPSDAIYTIPFDHFIEAVC